MDLAELTLDQPIRDKKQNCKTETDADFASKKNQNNNKKNWKKNLVKSSCLNLTVFPSVSTWVQLANWNISCGIIFKENHRLDLSQGYGSVLFESVGT